jgi:hypothetical protein
MGAIIVPRAPERREGIGPRVDAGRKEPRVRSGLRLSASGGGEYGKASGAACKGLTWISAALSATGGRRRPTGATRAHRNTIPLARGCRFPAKCDRKASPAASCSALVADRLACTQDRGVLLYGQAQVVPTGTNVDQHTEKTKSMRLFCSFPFLRG